jgi:site-specific recombinase XerD
VSFLANTGLRVSELISITKDNIEPYDNRYMKIRIHGKNDKSRFIYITYDLYVKVSEVFDSESIYLFASKSEQVLSRINLYRQIKRAFIKYTGKQNITPHVLRHLYATYQIEMVRM